MWSHKVTYAVGGLEDVGYIENEDLLVVLSSQGTGVFNCMDGVKVFRSDADWWPLFDQNTGRLERFPGYWDMPIKVYGLHNSGGLNPVMFNDWELKLSDPRLDDPPFEEYSVQLVLLQQLDSRELLTVAKDGPCEFRAFGFSQTGRSLFVASSCELVVWSRN